MKQIINRISTNPYFICFGIAFTIVGIENVVLQRFVGIRSLPHLLQLIMQDSYAEFASAFLGILIATVGLYFLKSDNSPRKRLSLATQINFSLIGLVYLSVCAYIDSLTTSSIGRIYLSLAGLNVFFSVMTLIILLNLSRYENSFAQSIKRYYIYLAYIVILSLGRFYISNVIDWYKLAWGVFALYFILIGAMFVLGFAKGATFHRLVTPHATFTQLKECIDGIIELIIVFPTCYYFAGNAQWLGLLVIAEIINLVFRAINVYTSAVTVSGVEK